MNDLRNGAFRYAGVLRSYFFAVLKRWGTQAVKKQVWEREFAAGRWLHAGSLDRPLICDWIEKYCNEGEVLDLGCSNGVIGFTLDEKRYRHYVGVDISDIAIAKAKAMCESEFPSRRLKNSFVCCDIAQHSPTIGVDVALFRQSLYYFNSLQVPRVLARYKAFLVETGVFIVVMDDIARHQWIIDHIAATYSVIETRYLEDVAILVFR